MTTALLPVLSKYGIMMGPIAYYVQTFPFTSLLRVALPMNFSDGQAYFDSNGDFSGVPIGVSGAFQSFYVTDSNKLEDAVFKQGVIRMTWNGNARMTMADISFSGTVTAGSGPGFANNNVPGVSPFDITLTNPDQSNPHHPMPGLNLAYGMLAHSSALSSGSRLRIYHVEDEADVIADKHWQKDFAKAYHLCESVRVVKMQSAENRALDSSGASLLAGGRNLQIGDFPRMSNAFWTIPEALGGQAPGGTVVGALTVTPLEALAQFCLEQSIPKMHIVFPHNTERACVSALYSRIAAVHPNLETSIEIDNEIWNPSYVYNRGGAHGLQDFKVHRDGILPPLVGEVISYAGWGYGIDPGTPLGLGDPNSFAYACAQDVCADFYEAANAIMPGKVTMLIATQDGYMQWAGHFNGWWYIDPRTMIRAKDHPKIAHSSAPYTFMFRTAGAPFNDPYDAQYLTPAWVMEAHGENATDQNITDSVIAYVEGVVKPTEDDGNTVIAENIQNTNPAVYWQHYECGMDFTIININDFPWRGYSMNRSGSGDTATWDNTQALRNGVAAFSSGEQAYTYSKLSSQAKKVSGTTAANTLGIFYVQVVSPGVHKYFETLAEYNAGTNWVIVPAGAFFIMNYTRMRAFAARLRSWAYGEGGMRMRHYMHTRLIKGKCKLSHSFLDWGSYGPREIFGIGQHQYVAFPDGLNLNAAQRLLINLNYERE